VCAFLRSICPCADRSTLEQRARFKSANSYTSQVNYERGVSLRAKTPLDELEYFGERVELPRPKYLVGTQIDIGPLRADDRAYYWREIVRSVIRDSRRVISSLQREGYLGEMKGKKMLPGNKDQIRAMLDIVRYADSVEPRGMHVVGTLGNQCYLRNGQCHSGVYYRYFLLFRRKLKGNKVVYIHPHAVIDENAITIRDAEP